LGFRLSVFLMIFLSPSWFWKLATHTRFLEQPKDLTDRPSLKNHPPTGIQTS